MRQREKMPNGRWNVFTTVCLFAIFTAITVAPKPPAFSDTGIAQNSAKRMTGLPEEPLLTNVIVGDSSCRIEWKESQTAAGYNLYLQMEEGTYKLLNTSMIIDDFVRISGLENGQPHRFALTSVNSDGRESAVSETGLVIPVGYSHKILPVSGGSKASDYRLFSFPFRTGKNSPKEIFSYFPVYDINEWRLFSREKDGYKEYSDIPAIEPGRGYWLLTRKNSELFLSGKTVNPYEPFTIQLRPGWNIIGSPYLFSVEWKEVLQHNSPDEKIESVAWEFANGGFKKADSLEPFKGYYIFNGNSKDAELLIPPIPHHSETYSEEGSSISDMVASASTSGEGGWALSLSAADGAYSDNDNIIGVDPTAETREDGSLRSMEPPSWPQHLSLFFTGKGGENQKFSSDIRKDEGEWLAYVGGGENKKVTISWETMKSGPVPVLIDTISEKEIRMSGNGSYTFARKDMSPRKFIIRSK